LLRCEARLSICNVLRLPLGVEERPMRRREFIALLSGAAAAWPHAARTQQSKVPVIGFLSVAAAKGPRSAAFHRGLRELGYIEGTNVAIEYRWADYRLERLPALAAELVARKVEIIVALEPPAAYAAAKATTRIPIVMRSTGDPVQEGLVASIARPGGNVTGLSSESSELHGKRLELLKELKSGIKRVAVFRNDSGPITKMRSDAIRAAAQTIGIEVVSIEVSSVDRLAEAFSSATRAGATGLILIRAPLFVSNRKRIVELAATHRLLAVYDERQYAEAGGLVSYGTRLADLYWRAATYVDKILKGAKPADLPVQQPTRFELVINLNAAKALGLSVPPALLARADQVIE
jgi:putative ABC transport system substrate-binding protein